METLLNFFKKSPDLIKILEADRIVLGKWPTPLVANDAYKNFSVKRDDLSGYGNGGIKTRKLETFLGYCVEKGYKNWVVIVPNLSNLRSDLEKIVEELKVHVHFIVANDPPLSPSQRKISAQSKFLKYTFCSHSKLVTAFYFLKTYLVLRYKNKKVIPVLPGASHPSSVMGAARGLLELYLQCKQAGIFIPTHVFIAASSGASAAGLILSSLILQESGLEKIYIHTVKVFPIPLKYWIGFLLYWTKLKYRLDVTIKLSEIQVFTSPQKIPYGESNEQLEEICTKLKNDFDLQIDHIYGARTWSAMQQFVKDDYKNDGLVFWHCGFTPDSSIFKVGYS